jgi:HAD superfamily hydrolase (TIGR01549 family)
VAELFVEVHRDFLTDIMDYTKILPGVKNFLMNLKAGGVKIGLITSDTFVNSKKIINYLGLQNLFDLIISKDTIPFSKISGIPAVRTCEMLAISPKDTIAIGDTQMDINMSSKAGLMAGVGVVGQLSESDLLKYTPYVINNYNELKIS